MGGHLIRWYSLLFGLTVMYCCILGRWFFVREKAPLKDYWPVIACIVIGGIAGARLVHVFFYDWPYFQNHSGEILSIWKGGLASHGGAMGMALAIYLYSRYRGQVYYWWVFDRLAVGLPLGAVLVRLGNLFNSELYGKPTDAPWAFVFAQVDNLPRHPVQVYEMIGYGIIGVITMTLYLRKGKSLHFGTLTGIFIFLLSSSRIFLEFFKESPVLYSGLNTAQWLSVPFMVLGGVILWLSFKGRLD